MQHILIPTDFSIRSLRVIHGVVDRFGHEPLNIVMMHAVKMPGSIMELMMLSRRFTYTDLITADYKDACEIIRNKYASSIQSLKTEFLVGNTQGVFRNFLLYHKIDLIACSSEVLFQKAGKDSYDPQALIRKSKCPVHYVALAPRQEQLLVSAMSELLAI